MRRGPGVILALLLAPFLVPSPAVAEGFYTSDLGEGGAPDACIFRAQRTLNAYAVNSGFPQTTILSGAWSTDGYDLQPGDVDVQFLCPYRDSHVSVALLVGHSDGADADRIAVVEALVALWNATGQDGEGRPEGGTPRK